MKANWDLEWTSALPVADTTYAVSPTHSLKTPAGRINLWYNGNTSIVNTRIYYNDRHAAHGEPESLTGLYMRFSSKLPASGSGYLITWNSYGYGKYYRYNAGVVTTLASINGWFGGPAWLGAWNPFRVSCTEEWGMTILKTEWWNGSIWTPGREYQDSSVSRITAGGYAGVFFGSRVQIDDVQIVELTT